MRAGHAPSHGQQHQGRSLEIAPRRDVGIGRLGDESPASAGASENQARKPVAEVTGRCRKAKDLGSMSETSCIGQHEGNVHPAAFDESLARRASPGLTAFLCALRDAIGGAGAWRRRQGDIAMFRRVEKPTGADGFHRARVGRLAAAAAGRTPATGGHWFTLTTRSGRGWLHGGERDRRSGEQRQAACESGWALGSHCIGTLPAHDTSRLAPATAANPLLMGPLSGWRRYRLKRRPVLRQRTRDGSFQRRQAAMVLGQRFGLAVEQADQLPLSFY